MGCDIHIYRDIRDKKGNWTPLKSIYKFFSYRYEESSLSSLMVPDPGRDYLLFGVLSEGVRVDIEPNLGSRGLPYDVSPEVQKDSDLWSYDGHSHNYATLEELDEVWYEIMGLDPPSEEDLKNYEAYDMKEDLEYFFKDWVDRYLRPFAWDGDDSIRIVYWFDN